MPNPVTHGASIKGYYQLAEVLGRLNQKHGVGLTEGQVEYLARHFATGTEPNLIESVQYGFDPREMSILGNLQEWHQLSGYGDARNQFPAEGGFSYLLGKTPLELRSEAWGDWEGPGGKPVSQSFISPTMGRMSERNTEERGRQRDATLLHDLIVRDERDESFHANSDTASDFAKSGWGGDDRSMLMGGRPPEGAFPDSWDKAVEVYDRGVDENGNLKPYMYDSPVSGPNYGGSGWDEFMSHSNSPGTVMGAISGVTDPFSDSFSNAASDAVDIKSEPIQGGGNSILEGAASFGRGVFNGAGAIGDAVAYNLGGQLGGPVDRAVELTRARRNAYAINPQPPGTHRNERLGNMERIRQAAADAEGKPAYDHYAQETGGGQLSQPAQHAAQVGTLLVDPFTIASGAWAGGKAALGAARATSTAARMGAIVKEASKAVGRELVEEAPMSGALTLGNQFPNVPDTMENRQKILQEAEARDERRASAQRELPRLNRAFNAK